MDCKSVGQANPDIAGIGILVAFVVQSLIAVIVSGYTFLLSSIIQQRWVDADPEPHRPRPNKDGIDLFKNLSMLGTLLEVMDLIAHKSQVIYRYWMTRLLPEDRERKHSYGGLAWLIGKQPDLPRQRTHESSIEDEITPTTRRLEFANRILLAGSDSQTFTVYDTISLVIISNCAASVCIFREGRIKGYTRLFFIGIWAVLFVAYFIVFAIRLQQWDNDGPFRCYKTETLSRSSDTHPFADNIYIGTTFVFIVLSFVYAMELALNLLTRFQKLEQKWHEIFSSFIPSLLDPTSSDTSPPVPVSLPQFVTTPIKIYIASMRYFMARSRPSLGGADIVATDVQNLILRIAMLQCPLHIYSIFALRASNERYLEEGRSEREWGFGQIAAIVLLGGNILQIMDGITGLIEENRRQEVSKSQHNQDEELSAGCEMIMQGAIKDQADIATSLNQKERARSQIHEQVHPTSPDMTA